MMAKPAEVISFCFLCTAVHANKSASASSLTVVGVSCGSVESLADIFRCTVEARDVLFQAGEKAGPSEVHASVLHRPGIDVACVDMRSMVFSQVQPAHCSVTCRWRAAILRPCNACCFTGGGTFLPDRTRE